jgi:hypothetical protein
VRSDLARGNFGRANKMSRRRMRWARSEPEIGGIDRLPAGAFPGVTLRGSSAMGWSFGNGRVVRVVRSSSSSANMVAASATLLPRDSRRCFKPLSRQEFYHGKRVLRLAACVLGNCGLAPVFVELSAYGA